MRSFSILRTNVGLTTNVKVVVDSNYNLFLESIDSDSELTADRFKRVQFNKNNFYDELVPYFFKDFPSDVAFSIKYSDDNDNMSTDFSNQYDDIYNMGAKNIIDNKNYSEEYEFFAPLYVFKDKLPNYFIIFRIDGPGLEKLTKDNFRDNFLKKFKTVKIVDLTKKTVVGEWIENNFKVNKSFPVAPLEVDFRNLEFTKWYGMDYDSGGWTYKSLFLDESIENENTLFDFEKLFFDGYKSNKIVFPNIVNFSFLFDDNPATPTSLRKWSINRYSGFYVDDIELVTKVTPFIMPRLVNDVIIGPNNIISSTSSTDPFVLGWRSDVDNWVEYLGNFYKVEKYEEEGQQQVIATTNRSGVTEDQMVVPIYTKWRIISDIDLQGKQSYLNINTCYINSLNQLVDLNDDPFEIDDFESADINLIKIGDIYHNLVLENGYITLVTDYGFNWRENYRFEYYINSVDPNYTKYIDLYITKENIPISFEIYRLKLTDIKDFDTQIVESNLSRFEYEKRLDITNTEEPKMYVTDFRINSNPSSFDDYIYKNEVKLIPTSSDYTANLETFRIIDGDLSDIWRKNSVYCRFGYQNSTSISDYPYLLNNNDIHEDFNRCCNTNEFLPKRNLRNLDYFYTLNSGTTSYLYHSLHIERNIGDVQDFSFRFELDKYLNLSTWGTNSATYSFDYFEYLFGSSQTFLDGEIKQQSRKWSYFDVGDGAVSNTTVFKGLKFKLYEVDNIKSNEVSIENINLFSSNLFDDYKFSILLSRNVQSLNNDNELYDVVNWGEFQSVVDESGYFGLSSSDITDFQVGDYLNTRFSNSSLLFSTYSIITAISTTFSWGSGITIDKSYFTMSSTQSGYFWSPFNWKIIKRWELELDYKIGDLVMYEDLIFESLTDNNITDPNQNPRTQTSDYQLLSPSDPFWDFSNRTSYVQNDYVYKFGDFWYRTSTNYSDGSDFWDSSITYSIDQYVISDGLFYKALTQSSGQKPKKQSRNINLRASDTTYWSEDSNFNTIITTSTFSTLWEKVTLWSPNEFYVTDEYVYYNNILYKWVDASNSDSDQIPGISTNWLRVYSFEPDTDYQYTSSDNNIIRINNNFYLCDFPATYSNTLDSGIVIYINKKWKNVLVNIYVNDETTEDVDITERDNLYTDTNSRLTAANFIRQINDLDTKYDFSNYTSYVIINEDDTIEKYDFDNEIDSLPYMLICEDPDNFELKNNTLLYSSITVDKKILKPFRELINGNIDDIQKIDYYNDLPLGVSINKNTKDPIKVKNYNSMDNGVTNQFYRFGGYYMPLFYTVELFSDRDEYSSLYGNYKFDEEYSLFGIMKQRILSKINRKDNILKLRNNGSYKSIYPMVDEFGYYFSDFFLFKSTWDLEYHIECNKPNVSPLPTQQIINQVLYLQEIIKKNNSTL